MRFLVSFNHALLWRRPPNKSGGTPLCIKRILAMLEYIAAEWIMTMTTISKRNEIYN
jgi:hypothetical protein